jgi:hypothetical protein
MPLNLSLAYLIIGKFNKRRFILKTTKHKIPPHPLEFFLVIFILLFCGLILKFSITLSTSMAFLALIISRITRIIFKIN